MVLIVAYAFLVEHKRVRTTIAPVAAALTSAELVEALRPLADHDGVLIYNEWEDPIPEAAAYRARKEGLIASGQTSDAPSDFRHWMKLTDAGREFIGRAPSKEGWPVSLSSRVRRQQPSRPN